MKTLFDLKIKIFADGADKAGMLELCRNPLIKGFTTNPTLMCKAGVRDYQIFALDIIESIPDMPISFEVLSDDFNEMERQAYIISDWGKNVYVKIPITNTKGKSSLPLVYKLSLANIKLNITAIMTLEQIEDAGLALSGHAPSYLSVFAGRIADTGRDPVELMKQAMQLNRLYHNVEVIWASPREVLNIFQADEIGCPIITVTHDLLKKLNLIGKNLDEYSRETIQMFYDDAIKVGYIL